MDDIGACMMVAGACLAAAAFAWLAAGELRRTRNTATRAGNALTLDRRWMLILAAALAVGAAVRFVDIDTKGISHPEVYTPGIDLPAGISEPPPRHTFVETVVWHFRAEPHPLGYYLGMWAWTKAFGATLASIRIPEAILGLLSIYAIYRVGSIAVEPRVGVMAAALISLHGFHIFWSQAARMYVPGAFVGLISTWLLLKMNRAESPRPSIELGYVAATVTGAMTVEFFWPLLCTQILWALLNSDTTSARKMSRIAYFQALAFILSTATLSHALMLARPDAAPRPTLAFLGQYFSFGFLFQHGAYREQFSPLPGAAALLVLGLSLYLIYAGLAAKPWRIRDGTPLPASASEPWPAPSIGPIVLAAVGASLLMLGIAAIAHVRQEPLAVLSAFPLLLLALPRAVAGLPLLCARFGPLEAALRKGRGFMALVPLQALLPTLVLFVISFDVALTAPRAYVIFVPYLLIVIATGVAALPLWSRRAAMLALVLIFPASAVVLRSVPVSARDYQGLARALNNAMQPDDLIFVPPGHWAYTPIFFYLDPKRLVARDYASALQRAPRSRVWVLSMLNQGPTIEMANALSRYRPEGKVEVMEARAAVLVPPHL